MLDELARLARAQRIGWQPELATPYVNTIAVEAQPVFPGDLAIEERLASLMRWNALAMVVRANQAYGELGGHIASYASAADLFEIGFNHFFHARNEAHRGDLVFFQPHSAPGVYARAFLEGRLSEDDLAHYRQELTAPAQRRARPQQLSAPLPDAGLLAVPDRLDGHRPDQLDLPRALHALPHAPRPARLRGPQGVGRVRRRRDGRARIDERAHAGRAREARQPGVGGQLQPAAPRRPGARQRPHHRRAREALRRRRLERHQAGVGQRLGRPVRARHQRRAGARLRRHGRRPDADLRRQGRPLQPRHLLRPERGARAPGAGHDRRADRPPQARRPRPREDPRRLRRGGRAPRPADRDPGPHQEGLRHGQRRPGQDDHALAEEARRRPTCIDFRNRFNLPLTRRAGHQRWPSTSRPRTAPRCATCAQRRAALGGSMPRRETACDAGAQARDRGLRAVRGRRRRQGDEHHHGLRAHAGQPA